MRRRTFLKGLAGAALVAGCGGRPPFDADRRPRRSRVAVLPAASYDARLTGRVREGLDALKVDARGRRVVLKPNFVEYDEAGAINTHPLLVAAAVDAFLARGAAEVIVAEGPGHRRDTEFVTRASGLEAVLRERRVRYVDLNLDRVESRALGSRFSSLGALYLPRTVLDADLFVSMPKLKTHHWAGVTLSMKNLFGIVPGSVYGWPKNPLHQAGIDESIVDIASTLGMTHLGIVDGIVGMEGDGPILGSPCAAGVIVMGSDLVALDATCARVMGLDPARVPHLAAAGRFLGNVAEERIEQLADPWERHRRAFRVLDHFAHLRA